jgi:hypothetical protein
VSTLRFTDGVEVDTSGEYRTLKLPDGWYVVGHGTLQPCADRAEAIRVKEELTTKSTKVCEDEILDVQSQTPSGPKFPDVHVQLSGEDGNVFSIIGRVRRALRKGGATADDIEAFTDEVETSGCYDEALRTVMRWVDVS